MQALVAALPAADRSRIGDQLLRSVESIRFNIAEGCGLNSDAQLARHILIALGSANEAQDQLDALNDLGLVSGDDRALSDEARQLRAMLASLHRRLSPRKRQQPI